MKWLRGMSVLVATVLAVLVAPGLAFAHDVPDMTRTGSVSATLTYDDEAVPGGSVTLYRVGDVVQDDGDYLFALSGAFAGSGVSVDDPQSADAARALADWALDHGITGETRSVDASGKVVFSGLELGLYLMVQTNPASGYHAFDPFLVGVPLTEDGSYVYDIDASPKLELEKKPVTEEPPTEGDTPKTGDAASSAPLLATGGVAVCLSAAYGLRRFGRLSE